MDIAALAKQFGITPEQVSDVAKMALSNESTKDIVAKITKKFGMDEKQAEELLNGAKSAVDGGILNNFKLPFG